MFHFVSLSATQTFTTTCQRCNLVEKKAKSNVKNDRNAFSFLKKQPERALAPAKVARAKSTEEKATHQRWRQENRTHTHSLASCTQENIERMYTDHFHRFHLSLSLFLPLLSRSPFAKVQMMRDR